ncbi:MAG: YiiD C-terminal domain-containing protein [Pseudomonadota bacterium]
MSPFDMVRQQLEATVPFATFIGVKIEAVEEGGGVASLQQVDDVSNHIGSMHAGAMFTLGEAASGAALAGALLDRLMAVRPVAAKAEISYLAIAKGALIATAKTSDPVATIKDRLDADGKVRFDIEVSIKDSAGTEVATMCVDWHVKSLG